MLLVPALVLAEVVVVVALVSLATMRVSCRYFSCLR